MTLQTLLQYDLFLPSSSTPTRHPQPPPPKKKKKGGGMIPASLCGAKQWEGLTCVAEVVALWIGRPFSLLLILSSQLLSLTLQSMIK